MSTLPDTNGIGVIDPEVAKALELAAVTQALRRGTRDRKKTKRGARHDINPPGAKRFRKAFKAQFGRKPTRPEIEQAFGL